jgi:hypothetical protein
MESVMEARTELTTGVVLGVIFLLAERFTLPALRRRAAGLGEGV